MANRLDRHGRRWFVRGTRPDGSRWESGQRHECRIAAGLEMEAWAKHCPADGLKLMVEIPIRKED